MGIVAEIYDYFPSVSPQDSLIFYFFFIFKSIWLYIGFEHMALNIYNLIFYLLLLFGSLFFYFTKGKEVRLLRFSYSVLFIVRIFILLRITIGRAFFDFNKGREIDYTWKYFYFMIMPYILCALYLAISYQILKLISETKNLDIIKRENSENYVITETSKSGRLSHLIIDNIILTFLFFQVASFFIQYQMSTDENLIPQYVNNQLGIYIILIILRFIYFPLFEKLFGATPAKFLTDSRVVNSQSETPTFGNIVERTLSRHIPFEAFSFLGRKGWHDSLTKTYVVKEKDEGIDNIYILLIIIFSFLLAVIYFIYNLYFKYY